MLVRGLHIKLSAKKTFSPAAVWQGGGSAIIAACLIEHSYFTIKCLRSHALLSGVRGRRLTEPRWRLWHISTANHQRFLHVNYVATKRHFLMLCHEIFAPQLNIGMQSVGVAAVSYCNMKFMWTKNKQNGEIAVRWRVLLEKTDGHFMPTPIPSQPGYECQKPQKIRKKES